METGEEGRIQFSPQPNTIPETHMAPESGEQPPLKEGVRRLHRWPLSIQGRRITCSNLLTGFEVRDREKPPIVSSP